MGNEADVNFWELENRARYKEMHLDKHSTLDSFCYILRRNAFE